MVCFCLPWMAYSLGKDKLNHNILIRLVSTLINIVWKWLVQGVFLNQTKLNQPFLRVHFKGPYLCSIQLFQVVADNNIVQCSNRDRWQRLVGRYVALPRRYAWVQETCCYASGTTRQPYDTVKVLFGVFLLKVLRSKVFGLDPAMFRYFLPKPELDQKIINLLPNPIIFCPDRTGPKRSITNIEIDQFQTTTTRTWILLKWNNNIIGLQRVN